MLDPSLIQINVGGVSSLREIIGRDRIVVLKSGSTIGDLLSKLEEQFGSAYRELVGESLDYSLRRRFNMLYNGRVISLCENLDMVLSDGDVVLFFQLAGA